MSLDDWRTLLWLAGGVITPLDLMNSIWHKYSNMLWCFDWPVCEHCHGFYSGSLCVPKPSLCTTNAATGERHGGPTPKTHTCSR